MPISYNRNSQIQLASLKQFGQLKLSYFMQLNRQQFEELIQEIESGQLFKRLMYPQKNTQLHEKLISYARFPSSELNNSIYGFSLDAAKDHSSLDMDLILSRVMKKLKDTLLDCCTNTDTELT